MKRTRLPLLLTLATTLAQPTSAQNLESLYNTGTQKCKYYYIQNNYHSKTAWDYCLAGNGQVFGRAGTGHRQGQLEGYLQTDYISRGVYRFRTYTNIIRFSQSDDGRTLTRFRCQSKDGGSSCSSDVYKEDFYYIYNASGLSSLISQEENERRQKEIEYERKQQQDATERQQNGGKYWWQTYPRK